jgi:hypothetical protein
MKNINATKGTSRIDTFRMADVSAAVAEELSTLSPAWDSEVAVFATAAPAERKIA